MSLNDIFLRLLAVILLKKDRICSLFKYSEGENNFCWSAPWACRIMSATVSTTFFFFVFLLLHTYQQGSISAFQRIWYSSFFSLMPIPLSFHLPKDAPFLHFFLMLMYNHCQCLRSSSCAQLSWCPSTFGQIVFSPYLMFCGYLQALKNRSQSCNNKCCSNAFIRENRYTVSLSVQNNECDKAFFLLDGMNDLVFCTVFHMNFY